MQTHITAYAKAYPSLVAAYPMNGSGSTRPGQLRSLTFIGLFFRAGAVGLLPSFYKLCID